MNIIFQVDGGLGKNIMATAMVKVMKKRTIWKRKTNYDYGSGQFS